MVQTRTSEQGRQDKDLAYIDESHEEDRHSSSLDDAQIGVKNIEAISQTWTKWSLIFAYLGYVDSS